MVVDVASNQTGEGEGHPKVKEEISFNTNFNIYWTVSR